MSRGRKYPRKRDRRQLRTLYRQVSGFAVTPETQTGKDHERTVLLLADKFGWKMMKMRPPHAKTIRATTAPSRLPEQLDQTVDQPDREAGHQHAEA